jgi:hypothetical protein
MRGLPPRLSLEWEGVSQIMESVREDISNESYALVVVAEEIDMANGNVSRIMYKRFLSKLVSFACINVQRITR